MLKVPKWLDFLMHWAAILGSILMILIILMTACRISCVLFETVVQFIRSHS